ncbi:MAG: aldehyde dehydrogenase family protein [Candidatus Zixiibacteriota bacterium]|jgi:acyl-CoA reductase-like NAD-dependent aldehyde dehydrogenase
MKEKEYIVAGEKRKSEEELAVCCPYDGEIIGKTWNAGAADVEEATAAAWSFFRNGEAPPLYERVDILKRLGDLVSVRAEELARDLALEAGKNIKEARGEVGRCAFTCATAAAEATRLEGEVVPLDAHPAGKGRFGIVRRFVRGPVLAITPFNFPLNLVAHKLAPALACGAPVVIKPASATPLSALNLVQLALEAGAPPGQVSVLPMPGGRAEGLVADDRFAVLTFTGSQEVGWGLKGKAGRKLVCLELGGNAAVIVHSDADVDYAVARVVAGGFGVAGQSCISVQRVYIHKPIYERFVRDLSERVNALRVGHPLDEEADLGGVIDEDNAVRIESWLADAVAAGARVLCGGTRDGTRVAPTVVENCPADAALNRREAFAPVVLVEPYEDFADAAAAADDSRYGLQAGVFTRDAGRIRYAYEHLMAGAVVAGDVPTFRVDHMPYGGAKESGIGREGPRYAIEEYTEPRMLVVGDFGL